jgi:hypothetical protein
MLCNENIVTKMTTVKSKSKSIRSSTGEAILLCQVRIVVSSSFKNSSSWPQVAILISGYLVLPHFQNSFVASIIRFGTEGSHFWDHINPFFARLGQFRREWHPLQLMHTWWFLHHCTLLPSRHWNYYKSPCLRTWPTLCHRRQLRIGKDENLSS